MSSPLTAELEAALVRELRRVYERQNARLFGGKLRPPVLVLSNTTKRLGQWIQRTRTLELSRTMVLERAWLEVTSVLEHEMAHQFVDEVLKIKHEPPHGPTFVQVCKLRGIDARAAGEPIASTPEDAGPARVGDGGDAGGERDVQPVDTRVIDRIRKLLALAGSENQHEAELAMKKAHELMLRHNIDQITAEHAYEVRHLGTPHRRANPVELEVLGVISEFFFVEVIRVPVYVAATGVHAHIFEIMGTRENVAMAEHVHAFLLATAERLWKENRGDKRVRSGRDRVAYQCGVMRGFRDKLAGDRTELVGQGLVWVGDGNLDAFFRARYPRVTRRRRRYMVTGAHVAGREAGRNVVLHKPVTSTSTGTPGGRLLLR